MEFKNLAGTDIKELLSVFNLSFSDYIVPFHLTEEQLISKINTEKINLDISVGVFDSGHLAGFILQAEKAEDGEKIIYNAGTGVIPEVRGKGLVRKMYDFILPVLQERNADRLLLEVIEGNEPAIRAYENLGFNVVRKLLCFRGNIILAKENPDIIVREMEGFQWENFLSFWDIDPSWQASVFVLDDILKECIILGAYRDTKLVGYAIYNRSSKKIYQLAVDKSHRKQGAGTMLFKAIAQIAGGSEVSVNNVDDMSKETFSFLSSTIGLKNWISQLEMKKNL
ncbi:GNAT family N-acetyltransferase [Chryseobacterium vaccae]|uniref:GNAT family N-acetyltransferase n=1 Tax=Chryseobacterium vaccae TaxID=2604424 RepID=UPI001295FB59|nr:GNAT family N-acetyltransferase [Chryseobacterium vaccae]